MISYNELMEKRIRMERKREKLNLGFIFIENLAENLLILCGGIPIFRTWELIKFSRVLWIETGLSLSETQSSTTL